MSNENIIKMLFHIPPFSSLSKNEIHKIAKHAALKFYPKDTIICQQERTKLEFIYIIQSGEIEIYYEDKDNKIQINFLKEGEILGAISLLMNSGISVRTAKVLIDAMVYTIPVEIFQEICKKYGFFYNYFEDIFNQQIVDQSYAATIASNQAFEFLSPIIPFSFLTDKEIQMAATKLSLLFYPKGTKILTQSVSQIESLYIIRSGAVERYFEEPTRNNLNTLMSEGELFGGISMLINNSISIRSLRTTEDTYFYTLPKSYFLELCNRYKEFLEYFTDTFGKRMLDSSYASIVAKTIQPLEESHQFLNYKVDRLYQNNLVYCDVDTSIQSAAAIMSKNRCSSILVKGGNSKFIGIVTDCDLREKVIANGLNINSPVERIISSPLKCISSQSLVVEALMSMMQSNIKHLGVTTSDSNDEVIGIITNKDIMTIQSHSPLFLIREISLATDIDKLKHHCQRLPMVIQSLISNGAKSRNLTRLITTISDAILNKLIEFAILQEGQPPCNFAFMVLGSEGRKEQTLKTDQDNAIIFDDATGASIEVLQAYFLKLGKTICRWLNHVGYEYCKGEIMAQNPKWCQPLSVWKRYFLSWMRAVEPDDLLKSTIFFDFRFAYGDSKLVDDLRAFLINSLAQYPFFLHHLARNAQQIKPPIGFFRNFIVQSKGEHRDSFDIKKAMVPIVDFARIYALKHGISETNTQDRLYQLYINKKLRWESYNELEHAYSFLMQLRFARQINGVIVEKSEPDNYINPKKLTRIEQTMLKEIFSRIDTMQTEMELSISAS
ncbi:MAG: cyclic nucleotide-binding domain-containing protein [Desulfamplus sp.]|nr:cyclic nucleotide-binding domain-containing protein [Desulfamplus sp.]